MINPDWSLDKIIFEHAYAIAFKTKSLINHQVVKSIKYGYDYPQVITKYTSYFTDGTKIKLRHVNYTEFNGEVVEDFYMITIVFE